jgi:hypothetical protein
VPDLDAAKQFLAANARVLDRRRFARLFEGGDAMPITDALRAYRNDDGGFGHALEPDLRAPDSQPGAAELALRTMNEADAWDAQLVTGACDWLERHAPREGGAIAVGPSAEAWPHAPWWRPEQGLPASLIITGLIAGTLHARGVERSWLDRATELMWSRIESLADPGPYVARGTVAFLEHVPDRERAERALDGLANTLQGIVTLDPAAPGEIHTPLDLAPLPGSIARRLFDAQTIDAHLDHLEGAQRDDGGWMFNWPVWSRAAELDWRGSVTVDALRLLRANGRL